MITWEIIFVILLLLATLSSFLIEKWPTDLTAMLAFAILALMGVLSSSESLPDLNQNLAVFANPAPLTIAFMFILSAALDRCGVIDRLGVFLQPLTRLGYPVFLFLMILMVGVLSAFINNTPVVVVLLPVVVSLSRSLNVPPSKLLIPLSYGSIFGGVTTLVGTSTNILASGIMETRGLAPLGMFEISKIGVPLLFAGALYMVVVSRRLLPSREMLTSILTEEERREFITEAFVRPGSELDGKALADSGIHKKRGVRLLEVIRHGIAYRGNDTVFVFEGGDRLVLAIRPSGVAQARDVRGIELFGDKQAAGLEEIASDEGLIVEGMIGPKTSIAGKTIREINFRQRFRMVVVAVHRQGENLREKIDTVPLQAGDTLLMMGTQAAVENLRRNDDIILLDKPRLPNASLERKIPLVIGTITAVIALASFNIIPITLGTLLGCMVFFVTGVISTKEAYRSIDWGILALIYGMLALGQAMEVSGTTALISSSIGLVSDSPWILLIVIFAITSLLTEILSNNAAVVVMTPIAIALAEAAGFDPRPFVIAICIGSSASFATPIGYQTNTYVYSVGGYRFTDFTKIGVPLNILYLVVSCIAIPLIWKF